MSYMQPRVSDEWPSGGRHRLPHPSAITPGSIAEKIGDIFDGGDRKTSLPMYKEKPYDYPGSRRRSAWLRRKRNIAAIALSLLIILYWFGLFSSSSTTIHNPIANTPKTSKTPKAKSPGKSAKVDWSQRQAKVKDAFKASWAGYQKYAWGQDEYHPKTKSGRYMVEGGMGWIIVDALDTLMLMNLTDELTHARKWMSEHLTYEKDHDISTFETTIRMLGGLLSAHYLSTDFPRMAPVSDAYGPDLYLEKAVDLADRLSFAYNSKSGVPFASLNPAKRLGIVSHDDGGASSTAEATTTQLEMKYVSKLTGETLYWEKAEQVMKVVDDNGAKAGLVPIYIYADGGEFRGNNIRLGSRGDSYYEYLIKQYLQTAQQETVYLDMWEEALKGINKHLVTYTKAANLTIIAERPSGLDGTLFPKMDHLVCFMPGTIALGATKGKLLSEARKSPTWGAKQDAEMDLAARLTKTCWAMYKSTITGLAPEIAHFNIHDPPLTTAPDTTVDDDRESATELSDDATAAWRKDIDIHGGDLHNLQRPETIETLFYMWRITGDVVYREWGWEMFEAFEKHTKMEGDVGYTSIANVNHVPTASRDNMESFWLAETLKYFYLLFGSDDVLPLDQNVFNTEAHPMPVFKMGKLFKTGWSRKARDHEGNIVRGRS